jgi:hypothetical protein
MTTVGDPCHVDPFGIIRPDLLTDFGSPADTAGTTKSLDYRRLAPRPRRSRRVDADFWVKHVRSAKSVAEFKVNLSHPANPLPQWELLYESG